MKQLALASLFLIGCASNVAQDESDTNVASPIIDDGNRRSAAAYPEAVLVTVNNAPRNDYCSGVLLAPRVVLTASHCTVFNPPNAAGTVGTWTIKANGGQTATASNGEPYNPDFYRLNVDSYDSNDKLYTDVALLYLDTPINIATYPTLTRTRYPSGTTVAAIGRKDATSNTTLIMSRAVTMNQTTASDGYPNDNKTPYITFGGDSGGPLFVEGTHNLVGTETRFDPSIGNTKDYWSRLDGEVYDFIQAAIAAHSGAVDPVADFVQMTDAYLCGHVASACVNMNGSSYVMSPTKCRDFYKSFGFEATARDLLSASRSRISINAANRANCLNAIGNTTLFTYSSTSVHSSVSSCIGAVTGLVGTGGACSYSVECASNSCNNGVCGATPAVGSSCEVADKSGTVDERYDVAQDLCSQRGGGGNGLYCDGYDFVANDYKAENTWTCKSAKTSGACGLNPECASMICLPSTLTCVAPGVNAAFVTADVCNAFK